MALLITLVVLGLLFLLLEILDDMEHISDQLADIAHSIIEIYEEENPGKDKSDVKVV